MNSMNNGLTLQHGSILCFGDSNTFGAHGFQGGRYPADVRWCGRLGVDPAFAGKYEVINMGENGRGIPGDTWEMDYVCKQMSRHTPVRLLVIMLGTNDLLMTVRSGMDGVVSMMDRFLSHLLSFTCYLPDNLQTMRLLEGPENILLIAPVPTELSGYGPEGVRFDRLSREFGPAYQELAARTGCHFADAGKWHIQTGPDGVHFTKEGHLRFADSLKEELLRILDASGGSCLGTPGS